MGFLRTSNQELADLDTYVFSLCSRIRTRIDSESGVSDDCYDMASKRLLTETNPSFLVAAIILLFVVFSIYKLDSHIISSNHALFKSSS